MVEFRVSLQINPSIENLLTFSALLIILNLQRMKLKGKHFFLIRYFITENYETHSVKRRELSKNR